MLESRLRLTLCMCVGFVREPGGMYHGKTLVIKIKIEKKRGGEGGAAVSKGSIAGFGGQLKKRKLCGNGRTNSH